jgi:hypothetical protein
MDPLTRVSSHYRSRDTSSQLLTITSPVGFTQHEFPTQKNVRHRDGNRHRTPRDRIFGQPHTLKINMNSAPAQPSDRPPDTEPAEAAKKLSAEEITELVPDFACAEDYLHYLFFRPDINPFAMQRELLEVFMAKYGHWHDVEDQEAANTATSVPLRLSRMIQRFYRRATKRSGSRYAKFGCYTVVMAMRSRRGHNGNHTVLRTTTRVYVGRIPDVLLNRVDSIQL